MFIFTNAFKSVSRSKGRNSLIGLIVVVIAIAACVALAIRNAANEAEIVGMDAMTITASITVDREKMMQDLQSNESGGERGAPDLSGIRELMAQYEELSLAELLVYADSTYVQDFHYSTSISLSQSDDGILAYGNEPQDDSAEEEMNSFPGGGGGPMGGMSMGDFTLTGYNSFDAMTNFISGSANLIEGEIFDVTSFAQEVLISNELALYNDLSIGDVLTLTNPNDEEETYALTIVGIYLDQAASSMGQMMFSSAMDPANNILMSHIALQEIIDFSESIATVETNEMGFEMSTAVTGQTSSTFVFADQAGFYAFESELVERGLPEQYVLFSSDLNAYESSLIPLQNLSSFATTLLLLILAVGAVILVVLNIFNIRERKYEIGVLTAIGIKKSKVTVQFISELLGVTLLAIVIGTGIGSVVSVPISNQLLSDQINQIQLEAQSQDAIFGMPGGGGGAMGRPGGGGMMAMFGDQGSEVTYLDQIDAVVDLGILGQLIGIGIGLTLVSSFVAVVFVMRYEPLKILANRN